MNEVAKMEEENLRAFYDAETQRVVEILKKANPEKIIRFGSSVSGEMHRDSDIDLCIVKKIEGNHIREKQNLRRLLSKYHYDYPVDIDLHVYSSEEYEDRLRRGDFFLEEIEKGEVVYVRK